MSDAVEAEHTVERTLAAILEDCSNDSYLLRNDGLESGGDFHQKADRARPNSCSCGPTEGGLALPDAQLNATF